MIYQSNFPLTVEHPLSAHPQVSQVVWRRDSPSAYHKMPTKTYVYQTTKNGGSTVYVETKAAERRSRNIHQGSGPHREKCTVHTYLTNNNVTQWVRTTKFASSPRAKGYFRPASNRTIVALTSASTAEEIQATRYTPSTTTPAPKSTDKKTVRDEIHHFIKDPDTDFTHLCDPSMHHVDIVFQPRRSRSDVASRCVLGTAQVAALTYDVDRSTLHFDRQEWVNLFASHEDVKRAYPRADDLTLRKLCGKADSALGDAYDHLHGRYESSGGYPKPEDWACRVDVLV